MAAAVSMAVAFAAVAFAAVALVAVALVAVAHTMAGNGYPYGYSGYYDNDDEGGCYLVRRRVMTLYGWRIRRVQICD